MTNRAELASEVVELTEDTVLGEASRSVPA